MRNHIFPQTLLLTLLATCVTFGPASSAWALDEVLLLGDKDSVRGEIEEMSADKVVLKSGIRTKEVPTSEIEVIRFDAAPPRLNLVRVREENGDLAAALTDYLQMQSEVTDRNVKTELEFLIGRTLARQGLSDAAKRKEAIGKLETFRVSYPDFYRYYDSLNWLGKMYEADGNSTQLQSTYEELGKSPLPEFQLSAKLALARAALKAGQLDKAVADFQSVAQAPADTPALKQRKYEAMLGQAAVLQQQSKHDEAIAKVDEVVSASSPSDTAIQAEALLRKGDSLRLMNQPKDALLAYLHVDVLFAKEATFHSEALYRLAELWNAVGNTDRAVEARTQLAALYPDSKWLKQP
ncbi:tetratricopeptide repeat protein [Stratiformator vulcanicus]|uniref:Uncharacterized protein n=1 Tax=Stratiformator vulcanicus TaxID=2527980 RepID=A0A517R5H5_9PLAN|nr:tetratricopeptide repeat protein [Stratiformator vulcanicus]QDT39147.1 hypothetical protein Pan189_35500 [Stratiformator vulcanicus]